MSRFKIHTNKGADKEPVPVGMHRAICYSVIDIGTQFNLAFGTYSRRIHLGFEITDHRIEIDGKDLPMGLHIEETASLGPKANLRKHFESWMGRAPTDAEIEEFDPEMFLGKACNVNVTHKPGKGKHEGRTFANINTIVPLMDGQMSSPPENELFLFFLGDHEVGSPLPDRIPDFVKDKILKSLEYEKLGQSGGVKQGTEQQPVSTTISNQPSEADMANLDSAKPDDGDEPAF